MLVLGYCVISYLLGSIPFAYLICGSSIKKEGSKNIGATNAARLFGLKKGIIVFTLDALKCFIPTCIALIYYGQEFACIITVLCMVGHIFPITQKFKKSGKGISCLVGGMIAISPINFVLFFAVVYFITLSVIKIPSYGSLAGVTAGCISLIASSSLSLYSSAIIATAIVLTFTAHFWHD